MDKRMPVELHEYRPVSLMQIAQATRSSVCTVSKVLNAVPGSIVSPPKREMILTTAKRLGYRPHRSARLFASGRLDCIGLAVGAGGFTRWGNRATATLTMETLQGVTERLAELNHTVMFAVLPEENTQEALRREFLTERCVDGLITMFELTGPLADDLVASGIEWSRVTHFRPAGSLRAIGVDILPAILKAVQRLAELGHRRVGYVGLRQDANLTGAGERQALYFSLCAQYGIMIDPEFTVSAKDETHAYLATQAMLRKPNAPTCLIYSADHYAVTGIDALLDAGKRVPEDISVVGYDDAPYASESRVPLSTIRVPRKEIGRIAAQRVVDLKREPATSRNSIALAAEWVERSSIGPAGVR